MYRILFFFPILLSAIILQTNRIEDALLHIDDTSWALFDLDDTVFESSIQYGRAKWYWHELIELKKEKNLDDRSAHSLLYPSWIEAQEKCPIRFTETNMLAVIERIQKTALCTIGITARHPPISTQTLNQLHSLSIHFETPIEPPISIPDAQFLNGVWFLTDYNKKGETVRKWLETIQNRPAKIIFIDDSLHNLENLETELAALDVEYIGIHYTKAHERPFDLAIARREWEEFCPTKNFP